MQTSLTDYEPKGEKFGCALFGDLHPALNTEDTNSTDMISINVSEGTNTVESQNIKKYKDNINTVHIY